MALGGRERRVAVREADDDVSRALTCPSRVENGDALFALFILLCIVMAKYFGVPLASFPLQNTKQVLSFFFDRLTQ